MSKSALYKKVALTAVLVGLMVGVILGFVIHSNLNQLTPDQKVDEKPELKIDSDFKVIGSYQVGNSKFFTVSHSGSVRSYIPKNFTETQDGVCINEKDYRFGPGCL